MSGWDYRPAIKTLMAKKFWSIESTAARLDCHRLAFEAWLDGESNEEIDAKVRTFLTPTRFERKESKSMSTLPPGFEVVKSSRAGWIRFMPNGKVTFAQTFALPGSLVQFGFNERSRSLYFCKAKEGDEGAVKVNASNVLTFPALAEIVQQCGVNGDKLPAVAKDGGWIVELPGSA